MLIKAILAQDLNRCIGADNKLLGHYPADLKFFKEQTADCVVIMGSKTFESLPFVLPGRRCIVISRSPDVAAKSSIHYARNNWDKVTFVSSKEKSLTLAKEEVKKVYYKDDVFIIGGATIYEMFSDDVDEWLVTTICTHHDNLKDPVYFDVPVQNKKYYLIDSILEQNGVLLTFRKFTKIINGVRINKYKHETFGGVSHDGFMEATKKAMSSVIRFAERENLSIVSHSVIQSSSTDHGMTDHYHVKISALYTEN